MSNEVSLSLDYKIDADELWSSVFGGGWENADWWQTVNWHENSDWDKIGTVTLGVEDPEDESNVITKTLGLEDILKAYKMALEYGFRHCGTSMTAGQFDDFDLCASDGILQFAMFGEIIYG